MQETYNRYNLEANFKIYLLAEKISSQSIKQYLSDYRHFMNWVAYIASKSQPNKAISLTTLDVRPYIEIGTFQQYKTYLTGSQVPYKTINRRLSTLRKLSSYCKAENLISSNPGESLVNIVVEDAEHTASPVQSWKNEYIESLEGTAKEKHEAETVITSLFNFINSN